MLWVCIRSTCIIQNCNKIPFPSYQLQSCNTIFTLSIWTPGPICSKLTMSLVKISLKLWSLTMAYTLIFLLKKMWVAFAFAKATHIFFSKNTCELDIVLTRTVNILTTNKLVKLTMLWATGLRGITPYFCKCTLVFWQEISIGIFSSLSSLDISFQIISNSYTHC